MFNVGDKVRCIEGQPKNRLYEGLIYTYEKPYSGARELMYIEEIPEKAFYTRRFELAEKEAIKAVKPKAPARKPGQFLVGDSIIVNSNEDRSPFSPDVSYDQYIGKMLIVTRVRNCNEGYQRVYCEAISAGWLDSRQIQLSLRKDGKPRKLRKPAAPKKPKAPRNIGKELDRRCETALKACCHYAVQHPGKVDWNVSAACYASLNYEECLKQDIEAVWENLSNHHKNHPDKPSFERWVGYILNRSPFKDGFKPSKSNTPWLTSIEWNVDKHGRSYVVTCALALREGSEYPEQLKVWDELVAKGYSEDIAWFLSGFIRKTGDKYGLHQTSSHACRHYEMSYTELLKVIKVGLPDYKQKPMSKKENGRYAIHSNLVKGFGEYLLNRDANSVYNVFKENIKTTEVGDGWYKETQMAFEDICLFADKLTAELKETK